MNLDNYPTGEGQEDLPEVEVVPLDGPDMEEYQAVSRCWCQDATCAVREGVVLPADEFCFQERQGTTRVHDGVQDTQS